MCMWGVAGRYRSPKIRRNMLETNKEKLSSQHLNILFAGPKTAQNKRYLDLASRSTFLHLAPCQFDNTCQWAKQLSLGIEYPLMPPPFSLELPKLLSDQQRLKRMLRPRVRVYRCARMLG